MSFTPLDKPLDIALEVINEAREDNGWSALDKADPLILQELKSWGYIEDFNPYYGTHVSAKLSYKGLAYLREKQVAIRAGEFLDDRALELLQDVVKATDENGSYSCSSEDEYVIKTLRFFERKGLVKNMYADNIPWTTIVTDKGRVVLAQNGNQISRYLIIDLPFSYRLL